MRVFVTGGTGAIGHALLPALVADGHDVVAQARSEAKARWVESLGCRAVVVDPMDFDALLQAVGAAKPEAIIHELTALASFANPKHMDREFRQTNAFRNDVTDVLLEAAAAAGTRRFLTQSFCGWPYARVGGPVKTEDDPLDEDPVLSMVTTFLAIRGMERAVTAAPLHGVVLRYGPLYGPRTSLSADGAITAQVRARKVPIVGDGAAVWSWTHVTDAASATVAALTRGAPGIYNIVDDEPARVSVWLPDLAEALGAPPPRQIPVWLAKLFVGEAGVVLFNEARGGSNAKAKRELGWAPAFASWRRGFREGL